MDLIKVQNGFNFQGQDFNTLYDSENNYHWIKGKSICTFLNITNVAEVIDRIVYPDMKMRYRNRGGRFAWYVRKVGVYQLAFVSKNSVGIVFRDEVFREVLPKIYF